MCGISRVHTGAGPWPAFLLLSEVDARRPRGHPLSPDTVPLLAGKFADFSVQYLIFSEFPDLDDASITSFLSIAASLGKVSNNSLRGNVLGTFQAIVGLWQVLARQGQIPSPELNDSWRRLIKPFGTVASSTQLFDAGRSSLRELLLIATGKPNASQDEIIGSHLRRACEQTDDFVLRGVRLAGSNQQQFSQRASAGIEQLCGRSDGAERLDEAPPGIVQLGAGNLTLTRQNLPKPHDGLEGPQGVASQTVVGDFAEACSNGKKAGDGGVVQVWKFGKDQILNAEVGELAGQQGDCFRTKRMPPRPPRVHLAQKQVRLARPGAWLHASNSEHWFQQLAGGVQARGTFAPVANHRGIVLLAENLPPGIEIPRNVGIAVRFPADTSHQEQQAGVWAKHAGGGVRGGVFSSKCFVVAAQLAGFGDIP